jgi:hypothetical protein
MLPMGSTEESNVSPAAILGSYDECNKKRQLADA